MLQWKIAWREMRRHPGRAVLTLLSVVIGVATVLAVGLSTGSARRAYQEMYETITGRTALEITAVGGGTLDETLLDIVRQTPSVQAAVPVVQRNAVMYYGSGRMKLVVLGVDPSQDGVVRDFDLVAGQPLTAAGGVLLDASLARNLGLQTGSPIKLLVRRGLMKTTVAGLVQPRSGAAVSSSGVLFMPLSTAQSRFAADGKLDRIQVVPDEDSDATALQTRLTGRLPAGVQVEPPVTRTAMAEETLVALESGLQLATAFSLLAAVFIITNTFLMSIGQRRKRLAVMRAVGATRRQVSGLIRREALLLAIVGTVLGAGAGLAGARLLNGSMGRLYQTELPPAQLRPLPLAVAAAFGLGVSLLGSAWPARRAGRLTPLEGLSGVAREDVEGPSRGATVSGVAVLLASAVLFAVSLSDWLPLEWIVAANVLALTGLVLLLPLVLRPLTWISQFVLWPAARVEARLARRQLLRHRGRTALTIGVLFVAVSTGLGLASAVLDNVDDVRRWYREVIVGDFFVRAAMPDMETGLSAAIPETVGRDLRAIEGVTRIDSERFVSATAGGQSAIVVVFGNEYLSPDEPPSTSLFYPPSAGDAVTIGSVLAQRTGLKVGETIVLDGRDGPFPLRIEAISNEYLAGGMLIRMRRDLAERALGVQGVDAYVVKADHARLADVERSLRDVAVRHGILLQSYAELTRMIEGMMSGVVGSLWGLMVLGLLVASFGVVNTLGMNVLEQTRELGLLRVVAMTRGQIRKTIMCQAAMLGMLGVVPGLLAGVVLSYVMNVATQPVIGHAIAFAFHPWMLLGGLAAAFVMVLAAAWIPAERAARLKLATALRYE